MEVKNFSKSLNIKLKHFLGRSTTRRGLLIETFKTLGGVALGLTLNRLIKALDWGGKIESPPSPRGKIEIKATGPRGETAEFLVEHEALRDPEFGKEILESLQIDTIIYCELLSFFLQTRKAIMEETSSHPKEEWLRDLWRSKKESQELLTRFLFENPGDEPDSFSQLTPELKVPLRQRGGTISIETTGGQMKFEINHPALRMPEELPPGDKGERLTELTNFARNAVIEGLKDEEVLYRAILSLSPEEREMALGLKRLSQIAMVDTIRDVRNKLKELGAHSP